MEHNGKSKTIYKRMQSKILESKGYSESIVSGRLHQNSDFEVRKCGKTCKRGPAWSCDVNNTQNVSCVLLFFLKTYIFPGL